MEQLLATLRLDQLSSILVGMFLAVSVKGVLVFLLASAIVLLFKRLSFEHRHVVWFVVIVSFVVIAVVWLTVPSIGPILNIPADQEGTFRIVTAPLMDRDHYVELVAKLNRVSQTIYASPSRLLSLAALVWTAGVLFFWVPLILGRLALLLMHRDAELHKNQKHIKLANKVAARLGISRDVVLMTSSRCSVPFTYGFRRPVIVLPVRLQRWTKRQLESVLIHELAHIRRRDCLTQFTARVICGLFWFVPLIWIVYARLQREQEHACDAFVIDTGIKPAEYAGQIVDLVRFSKGHILLSGMSNTIAVKTMLNERIKNVLSLKSSRFSFEKKHLLGLIIVCIGLLAPILATTVGFKASVYEKAIYGPWVNTEYSGKLFQHQRIIIDSDEGMITRYLKVSDVHPVGKNKFTVVDKWTDSEGNRCYKIRWEDEMAQGWIKYLEVCRVDKSLGSMGLVHQQSRYGWPTDIDPSHPSYRVYQRER